MHFTLIAIDDEPYVLKDLRKVLAPVPDLKLLEFFETIPDALHYLRKQGPVNFIFSDIQMPDISGIDGGKALAEHCDFLIYMTGFSTYSIDPFKVRTKGYLKKPIKLAEVLELMNDLTRIKKSNPLPEINQTPEFLEVNLASENQPFNLAVSDILYLTNCANYVEIHTNERVFTRYGTLKEMERKLCLWGEFKRINQSSIISIKEVDGTTQEEVTLSNGKTLSISRSYKNAFFEVYKGRAY